MDELVYIQNRIAYTRDEHAYKKLFFCFHPSLFRFSYHLLKDAEIAEEVVSDVMMRIWDMENRLAQVDNLKHYLFTSTRNACLTRLAKKKLDVIEWNDAAGLDMVEKNNPEHGLLLTEMEGIVESAVESLPSKCRMVFRLIKEEGFSHREVASILEISQNTIETHMRLALRKIRGALDNYLQNEP